MIYHLDKRIVFPDPTQAEPDGLLAIGGDLSVERLTLAYKIGIFPWYNEDDPILWFSPHERCVIFPDNVLVSRSMERFLRNTKLTITRNEAFAEVINQCSSVPRTGQDGTWITQEMKDAYIALHKSGQAESIEIWNCAELVGGIYGVISGLVFCGESMFSAVPNASKMALIHQCRSGNYELIDCQMPNPHLFSLGAEMISRALYADFLSR